MPILGRPSLQRVEFQKVFIVNGSLTRMRFFVSGWGKVMVKSISHSEWSGVSKRFFSKKNVFTVLVPQDSVIEIYCSNFFGSHIKHFRSPRSKSQMRITQIPKPESIIFSQKAEIVHDTELNANFQIDYKKKISYSLTSPPAVNVGLPKSDIELSLLRPIYKENLIKI